MDVLRRLATGRLAEVFGADLLEHDKFTRTLGFNRLARKWAGTASNDLRSKLQAYADGVNESVVARRLLPMEFYLMWYGWEPWTAEDTLAIYSFSSFGMS
jgi:penicillin amidase